MHSGVRAIDWREPLRMPFDGNTVAWKLYVRLFDEIIREFADGDLSNNAENLPFLHIAIEDQGPRGKTLVLTADPTAEP